MSRIVLHRSVPERLVYRGGQWVLHMVRYEALDRDLFEPVTRKLKDESEMLSSLLSAGESEQTLATTERILAGPAGEGTTYDLVDHDWQRKVVERSKPSILPGAHESVGLRDLCEQLGQRIDRLEQRVSSQLPGNDASPSILPMSDENDTHSHTG